MNDLKCFTEDKIIYYLKNYCENLLSSDLGTTILTFEKILEISEWVVDSKENSEANSTSYLYQFKSNFEQIRFKFEQYLEKEDLKYEDIVESKLINESNKKGPSILSKNTIKLDRRLDGIAVHFSVFKELMSKHIDNFNFYLEKCPSDTPKKMLDIYELFQLNKIEVDIFTIVYLAELCPPLNNHVFCDDIDSFANGNNRKHYGSDYSTKYVSKKEKTIHRRIGFCINSSSTEVKNHLQEESKLFELSLFENPENPNLTEFITDYFEGSSQKHFINSIFEEVDVTNCFDLQSSQINYKDRVILEQILNIPGGVSILFKGKPGTGKTELVKSFAKKLNVPLFNLKHSRRKKNDKALPRKMSLHLIQQLYSNSNAIFLVDECEDLINTLPSYKFSRNFSDDDNLKSFINEYLDENKCKFIFIANNTEDVDESTMRRFNYILTFNNVSNEHRETLLNNLFQKEKADFLSTDELKSLAYNSNLNIGHFGLALSTVKNLEVEQSKKKEFFLDIINNHSKEFLGTGLRLKPINNSYCLDGLNTDHDLKKISNQLSKYYSLMLDSDCDSGINLIFSGPPGSGKTEYAKNLANELKIGFIFKQASDLKSMYVGETEKNIKNAFLEAQNTKSILFIDEIDTFLNSRESAHQNWEISTVNEFLVCLENFRGIFICATNSTERLDSASLRRFLFKIKFDYLDSKGVLMFYNLFFQKLLKAELNDIQRNELLKIKLLTPSDFNTLKRKIIFDSDEWTHDEIISSLKKEVSYKKMHSRGAIGLITM